MGKIEDIYDGWTLKDKLDLIDVSTFQTASEISTATNTRAFYPHHPGCYTADLAVYHIAKDRPVLTLLGRDGNPLADPHLWKRFYEQLRKSIFCTPTGEVYRHIKHGLEHSRSLDYDITNYRIIKSQLDPVHAEIRLMEPVYDSKSRGVITGYSQRQDYSQNERRLIEWVWGREWARGSVFVLNADLVKKILEQKGKDAIIASECSILRKESGDPSLSPLISEGPSLSELVFNAYSDFDTKNATMIRGERIASTKGDSHGKD